MRRVLLLLPTTALLLIVILLAMARRQPAPLLITVIDYRDGQWGIFRQTLDGGYQQAIVLSQRRQTHEVSWSPDGDWMILDIHGTMYRYAQNARHLEEINRFDTGYYKYARWSEDGESFFVNSGTELLISNHGEWQLFQDRSARIRSPQWAGDRIVFANVYHGIESIASDGTDRVSITPNFFRIVGAHDQFVYLLDKRTLYKVNLKDEDFQVLTRNETLRNAKWAISADGDYLLYEGVGAVPYLVDTRSGRYEPLVNEPLCDSACIFRWSPDSQHVLILNERSYVINWYHVDLMTRAISQVTESGNAHRAEWTPVEQSNWHPAILFAGGVVMVLMHARRTISLRKS
jgi:Tol biopolymer transport system component